MGWVGVCLTSGAPLRAPLFSLLIYPKGPCAQTGIDVGPKSAYIGTTVIIRPKYILFGHMNPYTLNPKPLWYVQNPYTLNPKRLPYTIFGPLGPLGLV